MSQDERTAEYCAHLLTCPICHSPFMQVDQTLKCAKAHSFDIAREGYVNLLLQKRPGDTKEMLRARRDILEHGLYSPVSARVNELVRTHLQPVSDPLHILDAGCGTATHTVGWRRTSMNFGAVRVRGTPLTRVPGQGMEAFVPWVELYPDGVPVGAVPAALLLLAAHVSSVLLSYGPSKLPVGAALSGRWLRRA